MDDHGSVIEVVSSVDCWNVVEVVGWLGCTSSKLNLIICNSKN